MARSENSRAIQKIWIRSGRSAVDGTGVHNHTVFAKNWPSLVRLGAMLDAESKRCVRAVIRKIHPDKFLLFQDEQNVNSSSLSSLNAFLESLADGRTSRSLPLRFFTLDESVSGANAGNRESRPAFTEVRVELTGRDSLFDLFDAFGVEHSGAGFRRVSQGAGDDRDFLEYMRAKVSEAVAVSERFRSLSGTATRLRDEIVDKYRFQDLRFQDVVRTSCSNAVWQVGALETLEVALESLEGESRLTFANQRIVLHRERKRGFSAVQGREVHLVVNRTLKSQLRKIDRELLGTLSKLNSYWRARVGALIPEACDVLRVKSIVGDFVYAGDGGGTTSGVEDAVLWAGKILRAREAFDLSLGPSSSQCLEGEGSFHFTVLVHSDTSLGYIEKSGTMAMVRYDCPPGALVAWLSSEEAVSFSREVEVVAEGRREEIKELAKVQRALKARQVIRVSTDGDCWRAACERLLQNSEYIMSNVDMKGIFLAIDDQYEVWDTGAVSIPHDFTLESLVENLQKALPAASKAKPALPPPPPPPNTARVSREEVAKRKQGMRRAALPQRANRPYGGKLRIRSFVRAIGGF